MMEIKKGFIKQVVLIIKTKTQVRLLKNNANMYGVFYNSRKQKEKSLARYLQERFNKKF